MFQLASTLIDGTSEMVTELKPGASTAAPKTEKKEEKKKDEDEDIDLFGSDSEEDEEKERITQERLKAYAEKKSKKPGVIAKSQVCLDVKPWDDETNMAELEKAVKSIEQDGLVWGGSKLVPVGYGIKKLQVVMVIEDAKVSVDDIIEKILEERAADYCQSVDIVYFNKL